MKTFINRYTILKDEAEKYLSNRDKSRLSKGCLNAEIFQFYDIVTITTKFNDFKIGSKVETNHIRIAAFRPESTK